MADVVVVVGIKRGNEYVPYAEIKQMIGRAGRKHGDEDCEAYVLVDSEDLTDAEDGIGEKAVFNIASNLTDPEDIAFHLLPEIGNGNINCPEDAVSWFSRSFAKPKKNFVEVWDVLRKAEAIIEGDGKIGLSELGRIASMLYFHPLDVKAWRDNFQQIFDLGMTDEDAAVAWALGSVPMMRRHGDFGDHRYVLEMFREAMPAGLELVAGTVVKSALWWCVLGNAPAGKMRNQVLELRGDAGRIMRAMVELDESMGWGSKSFFEELRWRLARGVPFHLVELCRSGLGKGKAQWLYDVGIKDMAALRDSLEQLQSEMEEADFQGLRDLAYGIPRKSVASVPDSNDDEVPF